MANIWRMVAQRLGLGLITLFVISLLIFGAAELLPGDFAEAVLGQLINSEISPKKSPSSSVARFIRLPSIILYTRALPEIMTYISPPRASS